MHIRAAATANKPRLIASFTLEFFMAFMMHNVARQRPRATGVRHVAERSSRGSLHAFCSAISFVVPDSAELRLGRDNLLSPLHRRHHLHGLMPHLVGLTCRVTANQITDPNEFEEHGVPLTIPVVVFSFS